MTACSPCMPARYRQAWKGPADRQIDRARNQATWTGAEYLASDPGANRSGIAPSAGRGRR